MCSIIPNNRSIAESLAIVNANYDVEWKRRAQLTGLNRAIGPDFREGMPACIR